MSHGVVRYSTQIKAISYLKANAAEVLQGKLPTREVGTGHRISFADLIKFDDEERKTCRAALGELAQIDQELKL